MFNIGLLNKISPIGLDKFDKTKYTYGDALDNADAIMVRSSSMHGMELADSVKAIARAGAGVNNIPCDELAEKGIVVFNTPGANANAVKEMVVLGLLISSRKVANSMDWVKTLAGSGDQVTALVEKGKSQFVGPEVSGKTLGIVGLGAIGVLVANVAISLGMNVYGYDPYLSVDAAWGLSHQVKHATSLKEIYENSDYITLHVPATNETKGFINASSIAMMKSGVRILNFARGELVDEADMTVALDEKKVSCYVTDFPTDSQITNPNVVAFPHLGASTPESEDNCAKMAAEELIEYLEKGNIVNSVNMPNATMPKSGDYRICVIHKNIPAMVAKISTVLSENGINIENMINISKKDYAYTMIDSMGKSDTTIIDKIKAIDSVVFVRIID